MQTSDSTLELRDVWTLVSWETVYTDRRDLIVVSEST